MKKLLIVGIFSLIVFISCGISSAPIPFIAENSGALIAGFDKRVFLITNDAIKEISLAFDSYIDSDARDYVLKNKKLFNILISNATISIDSGRDGLSIGQYSDFSVISGDKTLFLYRADKLQTISPISNNIINLQMWKSQYLAGSSDNNIYIYRSTPDYYYTHSFIISNSSTFAINAQSPYLFFLRNTNEIAFYNFYSKEITSFDTLPFAPESITYFESDHSLLISSTNVIMHYDLSSRKIWALYENNIASTLYNDGKFLAILNTNSIRVINTETHKTISMHAIK